MTIAELLAAIHNSTAEKISISRQTAKHGNRDQEGDYNIIKLKLGDSEYLFTNEGGTWKSV